MSQHLANIPRIPYEGPKSKNPLAFKHYHPDEIVEDKAMRDHLRFSIVYWHTMCGQGADMFGGPTAIRPWEAGLSGLDLAKARVPVFFEIAEKLGMPFYAFHDRDVAPHGQTLRQSNEYLDKIVALLKEQQQRTGIKLLWGTAQLFVHPRYMHGAATSPNAESQHSPETPLPRSRRHAQTIHEPPNNSHLETHSPTPHGGIFSGARR